MFAEETMFRHFLPIPTDFQDASQMMTLICALLAYEFILTMAIMRVLPNGVEDKLYLISCITMIPKCFIMVYLCTTVVLSYDQFDFEELIYWTGPDGKKKDDFYIMFFAAFYIAISISAIVNEIYKDGFNKGTLTMLIHHVISIISYAVSSHVGRLGWLSMLASMCEVTNIPLSILYISKTKGGGVAKWMDETFGILLQVNGGVLWITFVIFRMIMFPYCIWKLLQVLSELKLQSPERYAELMYCEIIFFPLTLVILLILSSLWFYKIHTGMMKILRGASAADSAPEKAE